MPDVWDENRLDSKNSFLINNPIWARCTHFSCVSSRHQTFINRSSIVCDLSWWVITVCAKCRPVPVLWSHMTRGCRSVSECEAAGPVISGDPGVTARHPPRRGHPRPHPVCSVDHLDPAPRSALLPALHLCCMWGDPASSIVTVILRLNLCFAPADVCT